MTCSRRGAMTSTMTRTERARRLRRGALALGLVALAAGRAGAEERVVDETFDRPGAIPAVATYEKVPAEIAARCAEGWRWHVIVEPGSAASGEVVDGAAALRIGRAGQHWYAVQLAYLPVTIRPSRAYRVTFRARAERAVTTTFDLSHVGEGWASYSGKQELELGPSWKDFELKFTTRARDADEGARLELNFGDETANTVWLDDVRVEESPARP